MEHYIYFKTDELRPDFRLVCEWVSDEIHSIDTDGDSHNPASKEWTWLYLTNRKIENEYAEIGQIKENSEIYEIESSKAEFGYFLAYFLAKETKAKIAFDDKFENTIDLNELSKKITNYNINDS
ncbi:hypothetical protein [Aquimarina algiphila]|uniref:hypothetical protein n=1 Tax=Aquimarina algiphila TaxID=2047982 RepID=UPI00232CB2C4|nr:hypothetical protein [Aquimarina algiphila]